MSGSGLEHGADADSNAASPATGSLGISQTTDSSQPRTATGNARSAKAYVNNSSASATSDGNFQGSNDVTAQGNADTSAVAGAAGTDITASTDYGSRKSPDGADNGLQGGLHRPDFLSKGEYLPEGMGRAPRTGAELASNDAHRQAAGPLTRLLLYSLVMAKASGLMCLLLVTVLSLAQAQVFTAELDGEHQVPPVSNFPGFGSCATFPINSTTWGYNVTVVDIPDLTLAHFHYGNTSTLDGPVVLPLLSLSIPITINGEAVISSTYTPANFTATLAGKTFADLETAINAGMIYCNVHTEEYPSGIIRGEMA
ncbi:hypothetical protein WJX82_003665 [Trebouxia sp. C0006]